MPLISLTILTGSWHLVPHCSKIRCSQSLRSYIIDFDRRLEEHRLGTLKGIVGLQQDGGKDRNSRKLMASAHMHPSTRRSLVHNMHDTGLQTLNETWHKNNLITTVRDIMRGGKLFVPSVTLDNEASQSSGINLAIAEELPWLLHFSCGGHSIELLLKYCFDCLPVQLHSTPCNAASHLVSKIRNNKALLLALQQLQLAAKPDSRPLVLVQACRTRKWSASYLVVARVLRLQPFLTTLFQNEAHREVLGEEPNWQLMSAFCKRAYPFYLCEQILQRDSSNAVHFAFFWNKCVTAARSVHQEVCDAVEEMLRGGTDRQQLQSTTTAMEKLKRKIDKRDQKMRACKVFHLCAALWPSVVFAPGDPNWVTVETELSAFIQASFSKWIEFRDVVGLPISCTEQTGHMSLFLHAVRELSSLVSSSTVTISAAKGLFNRETLEAEISFQDQGDIAPQPHPTSEQVRRDRKKGIYSSSLDSYWSTFKFSHPHAHFIYHVLSHCCATEAGTERMFSSEKQIHSALRQAMSPDFTLAVMRMR
jgi:hypothetical protein